MEANSSNVSTETDIIDILRAQYSHLKENLNIEQQRIKLIRKELMAILLMNETIGRFVLDNINDLVEQQNEYHADTKKLKKHWNGVMKVILRWMDINRMIDDNKSDTDIADINIS